ncbi:MAG TPA: flagellin [Candidatus Limnocylindrales bacterium]
MGVRINTNIEALNAQRNLGMTAVSFGKSVEKLSSGLRINRAADDAAGLAISEKLRAQVRGLNQAQRNAQDAISMVQTAEGALNEVHASLQRIRELAVQYNNGTLGSAEQNSITAEAAQLMSGITDIANQTTFNGKALLSSAATSVSFQVGANQGETLSVAFTALSVSAASVTAISSVDTAIGSVSDLRGTLGAAQNRLESAVRNLGVAAENMSASESRIRDVDVASEMVNFTKLQILQQAGTAILAQANQAPQSVLSLLR